MVPLSPPPLVEVYLSEEEVTTRLAADVRAGLTSAPRWLSPKWLYDRRGCELFEAITELEEYYPTRAERAILARHAVDIAGAAPASTVIELGSGSSDKTRFLLDALRTRGSLRRFAAFDVAEPTLRQALHSLAPAYPGLELSGVVGDIEAHLNRIPEGPDRLVAFLGGTIGNFERAGRRRFLATLADQLRAGEWFLVGTDLVKDPVRLVAAYDDPAGVTAAFERNALAVVNSALQADFDLDRFDYVARWDPEASLVWMGLRSRGPQEVRVAALDLIVSLADGEEIRTETSAKFEPSQLASELEEAGFAPVGAWLDPAGDFAVTLAQKQH
ncbi:MAG: L-histidine N(alpha)-methyltransferase [Acidimicrobiales bacterium]